MYFTPVAIYNVVTSHGHARAGVYVIRAGVHLYDQKKKKEVECLLKD